MKYIIKKVNLRHGDGRNDKIKGPIHTNNIEKERSHFRTKYNCDTVNFEFLEPTTINYEESPLHPEVLAQSDSPCDC